MAELIPVRGCCSPALTFVAISVFDHLVLKPSIVCSAQEFIRQAILIWNTFFVELRRLFLTRGYVTVVVAFSSICCVTPRTIWIIIGISTVIIVICHTTSSDCGFYCITWSMRSLSWFQKFSRSNCKRNIYQPSCIMPWLTCVTAKSL